MAELLCSHSSRTTDEPLAASALDEVTAWLAIEDRSSWGRKAFDHADEAIAEWTAGLAKAHPNLRPTGLKQQGRCHGPLRVILADVSAGKLWRYQVDARTSLEDIDVNAALAGSPGIGEAQDEPVFLVCTHGKRDVCCARLGAPIYGALLEAVGAERAWQATHVGGHRFAPNVVVLPSGITYGRVEPDEVPALVEASASGRIYRLDRYRGRNQYPGAAQAAEHAVRERYGLLDLAAVTLVSYTREDRRRAVCTLNVEGHGQQTLTVAKVEDEIARLKSCDAEIMRIRRWVAQL